MSRRLSVLQALLGFAIPASSPQRGSGVRRRCAARGAFPKLASAWVWHSCIGRLLLLVAARYHYMLRALEGAFLCKSPRHPAGTPRLRLERHRTCPDCEDQGVHSQMFELGVCRPLLSGVPDRRCSSLRR